MNELPLQGWVDGLDLTKLTAEHMLSLAVLALMTALALMWVIFGALMARQAMRMAQVLPTPITPMVKLLAIGYLVFTVVCLGLVVNFWV